MNKMIPPKSSVSQDMWNHFFYTIERINGIFEQNPDWRPYCERRNYDYRLYWCGQPRYHKYLRRCFFGRVGNLWKERRYLWKKRRIWPLAILNCLREKYFLITSTDVSCVKDSGNHTFLLSSVHAIPYLVEGAIGNIKITHESYNPEEEGGVYYDQMVWDEIEDVEKIAAFINKLADRRRSNGQ